MNTKQLIVLWYACLTAAGVLLYHGIDRPVSRPWSFLCAIAVVAAVFIFSFAPHPSVRRKVVALGVLGPLLLIICGLGYGVYRAMHADPNAGLPEPEPIDPNAGLHEPIDPSYLELFDMSLKDNENLSASVVGRVRNKSSINLEGFLLSIRLYQDNEKADSASVRVTFDAPVHSQEAKSFGVIVNGLRFPGKWTWKYQIDFAYAPVK